MFLSSSGVSCLVCQEPLAAVRLTGTPEDVPGVLLAHPLSFPGWFCRNGSATWTPLIPTSPAGPQLDSKMLLRCFLLSFIGTEERDA